MRSNPCPFCGISHPTVLPTTRDPRQFFVYCSRCFTHGPLGYTKEEAQELWNKRLTPKQARDEDRAFQKALNKAFGGDAHATLH